MTTVHLAVRCLGVLLGILICLVGIYAAAMSPMLDDSGQYARRQARTLFWTAAGTALGGGGLALWALVRIFRG
jgi:hypothetical protein